MQRIDLASVPLDEDRRLVLQKQEAFAMPLLIENNASPKYPEPLLKNNLPPMKLCVDVVVDEHGDVSAIEPFALDNRCASPETASYGVFFDAVDHAIRQWRFQPALICTFPAGMVPDPQKCRAENAVRLGIEVRTIAVTLTYRFIFRQVDGRGEVRRE